MALALSANQQEQSYWNSQNNVTRAAIIVVSLVAAAILIAISAGSFLPFLRGGPAVRLGPTLHYFNDPSIPIERVRVKAAYFVPKDREKQIFSDWRITLDSMLEEIRRFHVLQFRKHSDMIFEIYPTPVIGEKDTAFYDSQGTARGNPFALRRIDQEVPSRLAAFFRGEQPAEYLVKIYIYEGVGASAVGNAVLFSSTFLSDPAYISYRSSLLYHELAHTLGAPEGYDVETNIPSTFDVMGEGRFKPLRITYIADGTKAAMGLK